MSKLKKVKRSDSYRILLTETLPYEVPILFSNENFHKKFIKRDIDNYPECFRDLIFSEQESYPFNYRIVKNTSSTRKVSLPHPSIQYDFVNFYDKYQSVISSLCSRSKASLRAPTRIASHFVEKRSTSRLKNILKDDSVEGKSTAESDTERHASSYFQYQKFPLLFKFYDSYLFQRLERQYKVMLKFDISKCFQSIYTHSITWAVKDKQFVKDNLKSIKETSFEGKFDKLMQRSNSNETNGILIGPEFSRIFAEIILQRVDENARFQLMELGIKNYTVKRYVDDYFVFAQNDELAFKIMRLFQTELEKFNLHLNESKISITNRPFITHESVAKQQVSALVNNLFDHYIETESISEPGPELENTKSLIRSPIRKGPNLKRMDLNYISKYKSISKMNGVGYEASTNIFLTGIRNHLVVLQENLEKTKFDPADSRLHLFLKSLVTISLYCFSMDMRYRGSYLVCQVILIILSISKRLNTDRSESINKCVSDEILLTLRNPANDFSSLPHEFLNLLILHKELGESYKFSSDVLFSFIDQRLISEKSIELDYFSTMSMIYYIEDDNQYSEFRNKIELGLLSKFRSQERPLKHAELFLMFVDSMSCPYVSNSTKSSLMEEMQKKHMDKNIKKEEKPKIAKALKEKLKNDSWFFSWDNQKSIYYHLAKKELKAPSLNLSY